MSSLSPTEKTGPLRAKRYKASVACNTCRRRKIKCDGLLPACGSCQKKDGLRETCAYNPCIDSAKSPMSHPLAIATPSPHRPAPVHSTSLGPELPDAVEARGVYSDGDPGDFASEIKAAIDAKLGLPSARKRCPIPLTDAPMFGLLSRRQTTDGSLHAENVLPPRKPADHLVNVYWRYIEPLEPLLEQERFFRSYQTLFTGSELDCDERIFLSTLNVVFALSTQLQENIPPEQRDEASKAFFQRAWSLLRPETIVWEHGSLELVQCLLLMSRYLQCTKNLHQTWMAVGSAVRIAQSLGLHVPDNTSSSSLNGDGRLRRQVWQCCVSMDRALSWTLGRTSIVPLTASSPSINSLCNDRDLADLHGGTSAHYFVKMLELNEIISHVMLSQVPARSSFAESLGLPPLYQNADSSAAVQIDECLNTLEKSLAPSSSLDFLQDDTENGLNRQRTFLRLRLAHARILLFRPMLARFCLPQSQAERAPAPVDQGLGNRILQDCATLCVENSQKMIALVFENYRPDAAIGILPWWYRVFYLYVATQNLIAAMLRPEVFAPVVLEPWGKAIAALCAHEHLSPSVQRCISTFQTMWQKVTGTAYLGSDLGPPLEAPSNANFQDVFQHLGFETELPLFGMENMAWLGNVS